eukprot:scaffold39104_cov18-Tisochrysis_lutea.AAC.1
MDVSGPFISRFTAWMGNFSHGNKQKRLLGELTTTMASSGHVSLHRCVGVGVRALDVAMSAYTGVWVQVRARTLCGQSACTGVWVGVHSVRPCQPAQVCGCGCA